MLQICRIARDEPVTALSGSSEEGSFRYWRGRSGRRYLHTVHALRDWPGFERANVLFARRHADGSREVLGIGRIDGKATSPDVAGLFARMAAAGADEVHVHLLAGSARARRAVERDLKDALGL